MIEVNFIHLIWSSADRIRLDKRWISYTQILNFAPSLMLWQFIRIVSKRRFWWMSQHLAWWISKTSVWIFFIEICILIVHLCKTLEACCWLGPDFPRWFTVMYVWLWSLQSPQYYLVMIRLLRDSGNGQAAEKLTEAVSIYCIAQVDNRFIWGMRLVCFNNSSVDSGALTCFWVRIEIG